MDEIKSSADWIDAYLEWIDAQIATPCASPSEEFVAGSQAQIDSPAADLAAFRESALLVALRSESDCLQILRRALEAGDTAPGAVSIAFEALDQAERLLEDERCAWQALAGQRSDGWTRSNDTLPSGIRVDWPHALEYVAADLRALTAKVMALRPH